MSATAGTSVLGYGYWLVVAREFPAAQVGLGAAYVSLMSVTALVAAVGAGSALVQGLPARRASAEWSQELSSALVIGTVLGLAAGVVVLFGGPLLSERLSVARGDLIIGTCFVIGTGLWGTGMVLDYAFLAERASVNVSARGLIFASAKIPLVLLPVVAVGSHAGTRIIVASWVLSCGFSCALALLVMVPRIRPDARLGLTGAIGGIRAKKRSLLGNHFTTLGNNIALYLLPVVVVVRLSSGAGAYFYLTWMVGGVFFMISSAVGSSLFAEGSHQSAGLEEALVASARFTGVLLIPAGILAFVGGREILKLFGAPYASNGTHLLWVLALASLPDAVTNLYVPVLRIRHRLRASAALTMGMAFAAIIGAWLVAPALHLIGVGLVWLLAQSLGAVWVFWDVHRARRDRLAIGVAVG